MGERNALQIYRRGWMGVLSSVTHLSIKECPRLLAKPILIKMLLNISGPKGIRITSMTEGAIIMIAHITGTVCRVSCSVSAELLTCCCHRCAIHLLTLWVWKWTLDTAYVVRARMRTTVSCCSVPLPLGCYRLAWLTFDSCFYHSWETYLPLEVIPHLQQLPYNG